ncbi:hypothetical protein [Nocardioides sp.]|uniref:hypothetical protein n=1 Tax=Nocardioides sp. TaxID=35761 RepID=UPI0039E2784D
MGTLIVSDVSPQARADDGSAVPVPTAYVLNVRLARDPDPPSGIVAITRVPAKADPALRTRGSVRIRFEPGRQRSFKLRPRDKGKIEVNVPKSAKIVHITVEGTDPNGDIFYGQVKVTKRNLPKE